MSMLVLSICSLYENIFFMKWSQFVPGKMPKENEPIVVYDFEEDYMTFCEYAYNSIHNAFVLTNLKTNRSMPITPFLRWAYEHEIEKPKE